MFRHSSVPDKQKYRKTKKLNIIVLCLNVYPPYAAGAEIHAYYVSNKLTEDGNNVNMIAISPRKEIVNQDRVAFKLSSIKLWRQPFGSLAYVVKVFLLAFHLRKEVDAVQVHMASTGMIPAFMLSMISNKPYVVTCHGSDIRIFGRKTFVKFPQKILLLKASKVVSVSKEIKSLLIKEYGLSSQSIKLVSNGYDEELVNRLRAKAPNNVSQKSRSIVFVGSLREVKDPLNLIEVFKIVSERTTDVDLQIVGDGPLRQAVKKKIEDYGLQNRVTMHGAVSHQIALDILASSEIYVSTSIEEGLPTSLIEAMALGKAVVTTRVGGVPEIVVDGENGLLTPPRLPEKMAQSIEQLLKDPALAKKLGEAAADSVKNFSWNDIAQEYLDIYREVSRSKKNWNNKTMNNI